MVPGQEEHCQGTRTVEAAQGVTEGPGPARVPIRLARCGASVAGAAGAGGKAGPGRNGTVSGPSPGPRGMTLARKDVSAYVGVVIPFDEKWTYRHEFLTRGQRRGETVEEYFRAKRDLLMDGDAYGDMIAAYPAYWSGLRRLELVVLMDARVL